MRILKAGLLLTALSVATSAVAADEFEYHGYMRSGMGFSRGGTDQVCFSAPKATSKARLGNECETYIENSFTKVYGTKTEAHFKSNVNVAMVSGGHHDWEPTNANYNPASGSNSQEFVLSLREAFAQGVNLWGTDSMSPWVGKRFYKRHDIHMLDFYLLDNVGPGAGVEDINLGFSKFHVAVLRNIPSSSVAGAPAQTNLDLRMSSIAVGPGKLETVLIHGASSSHDARDGEDSFEGMTGQHVALIYNYDLLGGFNKIAVQHGSGLFGGDASGRSSALNAWGGSGAIAKGSDDAASARKKSKSLRISEQLVTNGEMFSSEWVLLYQTTTFGGALLNGTSEKIKDLTETTFGGRPIYHLNKTTSIAAEYGYTNVANAMAPAAKGDAWKTATLHKVTLAPQFSPSINYWARPQLRLFATYAKWNEDAKGSIGEDVYKKSENGFSTGAQFEAWW